MYIAEYAFYQCTGLTELNIPEGVVIIGYKAFEKCTGLKKILFLVSIDYIGDISFKDCDNLTDVYYSGTREQWWEVDIEPGNRPLKKATIHYKSNMPDESE